MLTQLREQQAESQLPTDVRNFGVTLLKSPTTPQLSLTVLLGQVSPELSAFTAGSANA